MTEKPESLLSKQVKQVIIDKINEEIQKAIKAGEDEKISEFARAKKLIQKGCWTVRKKNPYIEFMSRCMKGSGGTLEETQKAMQRCALKWKNLPEEERKKFETRELDIYDYL